MQKHIAGLTWQNAAGDPTNYITILSGSCRDTTNTEDMILTSSITKRLNAAWVVGDNQGGRDTGAIADGSWHIWLIKRVDTGVVDVLFSVSATAPTMPTNYTKKRRIGSFSRIGGAIQTLSVQEVSGGGIEVLINPVETTGRTSSPTGNLNGITGLPSGVKYEAFGSFLSNPIIAEDRIIYVSPDVTVGSLLGTLTNTSGGSAVTSPDGGFDTITQKVGGFFRARCNTSSQLKIASANSSTSTATLYGWIDYRRD